jgi:hypothetical protein
MNEIFLDQQGKIFSVCLFKIMGQSHLLSLIKMKALGSSTDVILLWFSLFLDQHTLSQITLYLRIPEERWKSKMLLERFQVLP